MEGNSSGEELLAAKTRKPYTITKQRERWTEEEHNRFLEALKLYGRAWQRIEEHIGTKTAVQIRSHAQKFFTKLEKEALEKGIPPGQAHDIDIPPPRPKRKPNSPYPRKSSTGSLAPKEGPNGKPLKSITLLGKKEVMDDDIGASHEKCTATKKFKTKEISEDPSHSEVVNVLQDDLSVSISSVKNCSSNHRGTYVEFLPTKEKMTDNVAISVSSAHHEVNQEQDKSGKHETGLQHNYAKPHINLSLENELSTSKLQDSASKDTKKDVQSNSKKPVVNMMGANGVKSRQTECSDGQNPIAVSGQFGSDTNANVSMDPVASTIPVQNVSTDGSMYHPIPVFSPFAHLYTNQDAYRSFVSISSTFSSLIISTLLQNPASHAAARLAASFWPSAELDTSLKPTPGFFAEENSERHTNTTPSLEAIAAVTVAAATAWWAARGLIPCCPPAGVACAPPNTTTVPSVDVAQLQEHGGTTEKPLKEDQKVGQENQSDYLKPPCYSSKSLSLSLSSFDSDDRRRSENSNETKAARSNKYSPLEASEFHDSDMARNKKKQDRSSCGSNTPSGSDVEQENMEKHDKVNDETNEAYFNISLACDTNHRRLRSSGCMNESWKEVSEEGRLAFQELFKREVLPQSFSRSVSEEASTITKEGEASKLAVDLNWNVCSATNPTHLQGDAPEETCARSNSSILHGRFEVRGSGFKPYKRCSIEAKENRTAKTEETVNKRIRLQQEDAKSLC
ncbi:hypothetical protein Cni_G22012 [Canna indica]|uniref:LHY n=1 Tax=Canna indica TaxID=4628 RepID=A0AAQ3QKU4_9LILI|nr:hypothetical protein Cni_G22012 [Canna indica]